MFLNGKSAIVTGSTSGIGLAVARALAGAGADVMLNGFGDADAVVEAVPERLELKRAVFAELDKLAPPGVPVATLVAGGEADLGFQQLSELLGAPGIAILGPLPAEIQAVTTFTAAIARASARPEAARALVDHLTAPTASPAKRRHGMEPA